jgi:UDP-N-acetylglucosamine transferase subunit ALG13
VIFVTVGTQRAPFDRLLQAVGSLPSHEELIVQHGTSTVRPDGAVCVDFLRFDVYRDYIRRARVVVAHAGVGTALIALENGKRPVVMPRLKELGEEDADSHQSEFARRMHDAGLVVLVEDAAQLADAMTQADKIPLPRVDASRLVEDLRAYLLSVIQPG